MDGDKYFVSWDTELVKITPHKPGDFPAFDEETLPKIPDSPTELKDAMVESFLNSICSASVGRIANLHEIIVDQYGIADRDALRVRRDHIFPFLASFNFQISL